jgi:hypothetical protein
MFTKEFYFKNKIFNGKSLINKDEYDHKKHK